jgi:HAD superfamily hydrolase (TIGR01484 family)
VTCAVRLAVVDVDGCLTPGEAQAWDWQALRAIQKYNERARRGEAVPSITLCTGRQEPYVEAMMQAIGASFPGIYENGAGLYLPTEYRFVEHPAIGGEVREALSETKRTLQRAVVSPGLGHFQPGKEVSLTLYPLAGITVSALHLAVSRALTAEADLLTVRVSVSCVDVTPLGIDKGEGVRWLSAETGIPLTQMGGIGDSSSDLSFLRLVGHSAAPANATAQVRAEVGYVSPYEHAGGVVDILRHWCDKSR